VLYSGRTPLSFDMGAGHFGVELFFIISGFVPLMTIERRKTVRAFAIARFTRLMPAFLAALVLAGWAAASRRSAPRAGSTCR
jgi:peptidoglycan/LPS O-acetylase OafA/YrhL